VCIVDNIVRAVPGLTEQIRLLSSLPRSDLQKIVEEYDHKKILQQAVQEIQDNLSRQFQEDLE